jgi:hypothetical protein
MYKSLLDFSQNTHLQYNLRFCLFQKYVVKHISPFGTQNYKEILHPPNYFVIIFNDW